MTRKYTRKPRSPVFYTVTLLGSHGQTLIRETGIMAVTDNEAIAKFNQGKGWSDRQGLTIQVECIRPTKIGGEILQVEEGAVYSAD